MRIENGMVTVERGDSAASIAHELGVPYDEILALNPKLVGPEAKPFGIGERVNVPEDVAEAIADGSFERKERHDRYGRPIPTVDHFRTDPFTGRALASPPKDD